MSKVTVVTDAQGQIQAIGHGHLTEATARKRGSKEIQSGIRALPGQKIHELDLADDVAKVKTWKELVEKVRPHVKATAA
jgi:hypothetical protein